MCKFVIYPETRIYSSEEYRVCVDLMRKWGVNMVNVGLDCEEGESVEPTKPAEHFRGVWTDPAEAQKFADEMTKLTQQRWFVEKLTEGEP